MLVNDYGEAIAAGGWSTPAGCCRAPSGTNFGGSVPSLHPTGSLRSLRSHHSVQGPVETPRRCLHCHPVNNPIHASYLQHQQQLLLQQHHRQHQQHQQQTHQHPQYYTPNHHDEQNGTHVPQRNGSYHYRNDRGVDYRGDRDPRLRSADMEESIAGHTNWGLDDLRSLHRCVPALRRPGIDVAGMRAHFYPEGGWGWLVCAAGFLALLLTTGMQLAFGLLHLYAARHLGENHLMDIAWVGALSAAVSRGSAPLVVGACRRGSTRLTAVIGGLVLALASLFTSFAVQMHQVLLSFLNELNSRAACGMLMNFALNMAYLWIVYKLNPSAECSYGLVLGAGAGLVKETAGLVLGHYFRKRREFVEMVVQAGTGVGIALFSVFYREAVGKLGWRLGLQSVTGALSLAFFLGLVYRSASLYHPQRRAILHLKNQQSKVKERKPALRTPRQPLVDLSPLGSRPVRMLMLAAGAAGFGLYSPAFYIALQGYQDGLEASALVLLQTCLGLAAALGCAGWGVITARPSAQCLVSRQYLCQAALIGVAVAQVALGSVQGYHGLVLASGLYGASLGGVLYSLKMLALERLRARHFSRAWALVQAAEALPILLGVPLTGYMNASSPRVGYYACTLSSLSGAALLFLVGWGRHPSSPALGPPPPPCACPPPPRPRLPKSQSLHVPLAIDVDDDAIPQPMELPGYFHPHFHGTLRPSKSYPEGLSYPEFYRTRPRAHRDVTVIEQITTSV